MPKDQLTIELPSPGSSQCKFTLAGLCSGDDCGTVKIQLSYKDSGGVQQDIILGAPCTEYGWSIPIDLSVYKIPNGAVVQISVECGNNKVNMNVKCNCPAAAKGAAAG